MKQKHIYIVRSGGSYEYSLEGVFTEKHFAEMYLSEFLLSTKDVDPDDYGIDEVELNPFIDELIQGESCFFVKMSKEGECLDAKKQNDFFPKIPTFNPQNNLIMATFASNREEAIQIADAKRQEILDRGEWPSPQQEKQGRSILVTPIYKITGGE